MARQRHVEQLQTIAHLLQRDTRHESDDTTHPTEAPRGSRFDMGSGG
jgi:hypothetical protein